MMPRSVVDPNPQYMFEGYPLTMHRAPREQLVELPDEWLASSPGPSPKRIPTTSNDHDLVNRPGGRPIGQRITVFGHVLDRMRRPVPGAMLELWQTNAAGRYVDDADPDLAPVDPNFVGRGTCVTGLDGSYRFHTIRPSPYQWERGGRYRPAHLHVSVIGHDVASRLITQCYFPDDPFVTTDHVTGAVLDPRGIDRLTATFAGVQTEPNGVDSSAAYRWDIVLRGRSQGNAEPLDPTVPVVLTPSQTIGPLYGFALMFDGCSDAAGSQCSDAVRLRGRVLDGAGEPVAYPSAMVEIWEGSQFVRARTDGDGCYEAQLLRPQGQRLADGQPMAPHFKVTVFGQGLMKQAQTIVYLPEHDAESTDPILRRVAVERRPTLVATRLNELDYSFDIRLQGPQETAFFKL